MCLTTIHLDLGPADALVDLKCGRLIIRPTLTPAEQIAAARGVLTQASVTQPEDPGFVRCACGDLLVVVQRTPAVFV